MFSSKTLNNLLAPALAASLLVVALPLEAGAKARQVDDYRWEGVARVVAVGDLHGDYDQYLRVLADAGLVDERGRWSGGETHLVQTGDVPDRGPDTRRILDHLEKLKKEARKKGGAVHTLVGNHEAMNVYGDLRYVTQGEFDAFRGKQSERLWQLQWEHHLRTMQERDPEAFAALDQEAFRKEWEQQYPLGWVEHRSAWAPQGEYGSLVMANPVVLQINDTLYLHGGLSAKYCKLSLAEVTEQVRAGMANFNHEQPGIVEDELGPLWYRGLASDDEALRGPMVTAILARYGAARMVVGHTVTQGIVWPRFDGRVILNDVGIAAYYGGYRAYLELGPEGPVAHYGRKPVKLPTSDAARLDYLRQVVALNPTNGHLQSRLQRMQASSHATAPLAAAGEAVNGEAVNGAPTSGEPAGAEPVAGEASGAGATEQPDPAIVQREAWLSPDNCQ